jgi:hypothetical protein
MSLFVTLMIGGWTTAITMIGFYALKESGQLVKIHKRIGVWLETSAPRLSVPEPSMQPDREDVS